MREKVILVNYTGKKGGGAAYSYEMAKAVIELGYPVVAVISDFIENKNLWEQLPFLKLYRIKTYNSLLEFIYRTFLLLFILRGNLRREFKHYEIVSVYCPMIQPWTYFINSVFTNARKVVTVHDPEPHSGSNFILDKLNQFTAARSDEIIILSEKFREYSIAKFEKKTGQVHVVPHGAFSYYQNVQSSKIVIEYPSTKINFLFFGRITKYKGLDVLGKAYRKVCEQIDCTLTIAGSGDFGKYSREFEGIQDVRLINRWLNDEEVGSLFKGPNIIVVLPYIDATQSGVIPIAHEYGIPVIASDTGGLSEQVINGKTGILVKPGDSSELAKWMLFLATNEQLKQRIGNEAKAQNKRLSWNHLASKLVDVLMPV